jgi:hypothetical protein
MVVMLNAKESIEKEISPKIWLVTNICWRLFTPRLEAEALF